MIRKEIKDNISEYSTYYVFEPYGYSQVYDSFPCVFPTVDICLEPCLGLYRLADKLRKEDGETPLIDDQELGYEFFIRLNGYNPYHIDTYIHARAYDDSGDYFIDLSDDEQAYVYDCLNKEIDCEEELKCAVDYHKKVYGEELTILERR